MNDVAKLPKWAQEKIGVLESRLEAMTQRARAYEKGESSMVFLKNLELTSDCKPLYLPSDRQIRFRTGMDDWRWIDVRLRKTSEFDEAFLELMAGGDLVLRPEVRNVTRVFVQ